MANEDTKLEAPPYVAFKTLTNFLDKLGKIGTPPRIDRSVWGDSLSGGYGSQLMAALRFLELVDEDGYALPTLQQVAENAELRKVHLRDRLPGLYAPVLEDFGVDLSDATPAQLDEAFMEKYKISGATKTKATAFLVHAARLAGLPISPYIERKTRQGSSSNKPRRRPRSKRPDDGSKPDNAQGADRSDTPERIVNLSSGGTVRMVLDYNPFKLTSADRAFVFGLIDAIQQYESEGEAVE